MFTFFCLYVSLKRTATYFVIHVFTQSHERDSELEWWILRLGFAKELPITLLFLGLPNLTKRTISRIGGVWALGVLEKYAKYASSLCPQNVAVRIGQKVMSRWMWSQLWCKDQECYSSHWPQWLIIPFVRASHLF